MPERGEFIDGGTRTFRLNEDGWTETGSTPPDPRLHPCFARCFRIYRNAVTDWHASASIQDAARTLGMGARAYADARLAANQFQWHSSTTSDPFTREHADLAYKLAVEDVCGVAIAGCEQPLKEART